MEQKIRVKEFILNLVNSSSIVVVVVGVYLIYK